ncbi:MAG: hypothetical protein SV375_08085, partial [Thermodesulfobacteriota bacterium]|nr:hypothetical protein [Thermodesulfobacteriota bacterium]
ESNDGVLMTGMVIPELSINFAGASRMKCSAQVIYRMEEKEKGVHCGLAILDMDINAYTHLTDILINALDPNGYVSNEIDMDDLWEFFFNSGFIYPKKYELIKAYREDFKKTYQKLYKLESPEIVKHFTYQKNGRIYGHLSMIRAYERSWLIQHHASRAMEGKRAGFMVLRQIVYFMNDVRRLPSPKVKYLICHYRPDNKFPDRVFGGFARSLNNSGGCSMDLFSYLYFINPSVNTKLPEGWLLSACSELDLWELNRFYSYYSNGLLLNSLCMGQNNSGNNALTSLYDKVGLKRRYKEYSLSFNGELNAVLIVDQSDLGLNLSEFLNAIKVLVTNPEGLPWDILSIAIARLATLYKKMTKVPILIYPMEYVNKKSVVYEKEYQIWILDLDYGSEFVEYMETRFRVSYK